MIIPAKERMTITRSTRFHLQISSYNIVSVRSTFGLLLYNTIVQFTFIESDYKVVNKATASDNHLLKWPLETRKLFARGRGTYQTIRITFSVFVSFSIKRQAFISHWFNAFRFFLLKWIKVTSHALYHRKRIETCYGSLSLQGEHHCPHSFRLLFLPYDYCCCCCC